MKISPAISHAFKWGSITGTAVLILHLLSFYTLSEDSGFMGFLPVLAIATGMFVSAIRYRNQFKGGISGYGPMFGQTFGVGVMSSLFYLIFIFLLAYRLDLLFVDKYIESFQETMKTIANAPELYNTPEFADLYRKVLIPSLFFGDLFSNTLYALIIAWAAVRKPWNINGNKPWNRSNEQESVSDQK